MNPDFCVTACLHPFHSHVYVKCVVFSSSYVGNYDFAQLRRELFCFYSLNKSKHICCICCCAVNVTVQLQPDIFHDSPVYAWLPFRRKFLTPETRLGSSGAHKMLKNVRHMVRLDLETNITYAFASIVFGPNKRTLAHKFLTLTVLIIIVWFNTLLIIPWIPRYSSLTSTQTS